jgi:hypothetical protein
VVIRTDVHRGERVYGWRYRTAALWKKGGLR